MDKFVSICRLRGLEVSMPPENRDIIKFLAELVFNEPKAMIPTFAYFESLALPIASEWIVGESGTLDYATVFCRLSYLAPILPFLQPLTEHFLVMQNGSTISLASMDNADVLSGITRLLLHDYSRFNKYFSAEEIRAVASKSEDVRIRNLALAALALLMEASEHEFEEWTKEYCGSNAESERFYFQHILQSARIRVEDCKLINSLTDEKFNGDVEFENPLVTKIGGVFVPRLGGSGNLVNNNQFISTETSMENLRRVAEALLKDKPLLLVGDRGSGKTCIVEYLHGRVRGGELVHIHLGDQTDAKSLVGTYTTGQKPGTFEWTPGALTSAVQNGSWVLIEDIDRAPNEVVAVLLSLLTTRELVIPSRNQVVKAAPGFQIMATTSNVLPSRTQASIDVIGARSMISINIDSPKNGDLEILISTIKPFLTPLAASMLVTTFRRVEEWQDQHKLSRLASTRDLVKLVHRIGPKYSSDDIFREAVSCFTSFLPDPWPLSRVIGDSMGIGTSQIEPLLKRHQPSISISDHRLVLGRAEVERRNITSSAARNLDSQLQSSKFALTQPTLRLFEEIAIAVEHVEPVLLVGETGTGKTAVVQHLAKLCRRKLVVINVSQQVETGDLIGGFKPVDARQLSGALLEEFTELFDATFSRAKNHQFLDVLERVISKQQWTNVIKLLREAIKMANARSPGTANKNSKRMRAQDASTQADWNKFALQIDAFEQRLKAVQQAAQFQFIEGLLVRAIRQGSWVLLDELNLAPADTIEGIGELLSSRQLTLLEAGGQVVRAHPAFRLFANMNPATDVGKRDLPAAVRSQFTELWSPSPETDQEALRAIVSRYLPSGTEGSVVNDVALLYTDARNLAASHQLVDGAGQRPHFSIRTLSRALTTATQISSIYGLRRALFEAFCMCFLTLLDEESASKLNVVVEDRLLSKLPNRKSVLNYIPTKPTAGEYVQFSHWWMPCGEDTPIEANEYILTESVERNLLNLVRAASTKMFPILIQGPTSSGKTSMISYLAKRTGHSVVRINNHEHTDLAEYLGGYESDADGRLVFKEGALVKALRQGHWLVLDELNLAPTDVLEALNRLLDDNRELLVPETQEIIKPHPNFVLFATQNPPGLYAGRKILSRAFRNRFLELHFGDIPEQELEVILRERSGIAPSYAAKIVEVHRELARQRIQRVFEHAATLRDLFRWARRPAVGYEELAFNGYALLGERSRTKQDRDAIRNVIEQVMKVSIDTNVARFASTEVMKAAPGDIVWTSAMRRVLALVEMAISQNEPVLLVGETGCGKTTIVQALASARKQELLTLNAHQNTETGDLVGSQRPVRTAQSSKLFEWVDGPLVVALRSGSMFLLDEISLADDSVLERLNSVLETERALFVPEIGVVEAKDQFQFFSTMNPGGDYGKKELSPALRNRFTEIWCPTVDDDDDLRMIISKRLIAVSDTISGDHATNVIIQFSKWFTKEFGLVSLRDILSWTEFINAVGLTAHNLVHGACMVFIDGLGIQAQLMSNSSAIERTRKRCLTTLGKFLGGKFDIDVDSSVVDLSKPEVVSIGGFTLPRETTPMSTVSAPFSLAAPTSALNAMRVVRAMQVHKPVLLEGSPGAGKTSLIAALAQLLGKRLTRINLSDQTDLADLFGQDVPLEEPGKFGWRSAPFLRAMQEGEWVLLDEMNLAPQPVLEGLNACLDHRGEAYIPELDRTFSKHPNFTVFAAQNPQGQGGGRKGLPKSFINRFSVVYVDQLGLQDLHEISAATHPNVSPEVRQKLATFIEDLAEWTSKRVITGGPFEFNLRDTLRWLDLISAEGNSEYPQKYFNLIVLQRFRTRQDREMVGKIFAKYFPPLDENYVKPVKLSPTSIQFGDSITDRTWSKWRVHDSLSILPGKLDILETAIRCLSLKWPLILTGSSGSGKSSLIRLLAQLCGAKLREFAMTPDVDSTDLLGEFDQLEYHSELQRLWNLIEDYVKTSTRVEDAYLVDAIRNRDLDLLDKLIANESDSPIQKAIQDFRNQDFSKPIFRWVDGMLVRAVEHGDWLVLDNANLCSAAVLDRLNSLLERGGSLVVNECANSDGSPREIIPHPNFRLFLTVNPRYGELSRAMRNRGVEAFLMPDVSDFDELTKQKLTVTGALPLQFSRPLPICNIIDLKSKSWLRGILLDESVSPEYLRDVDEELKLFQEKSLKHNWPTSNAIELYESWCEFILITKLAQAMAKQSTETLLERSALRRLRDSIECEFDVYGIVEQSLQLIRNGGTLGSMLFELVDVRDPSRIPVFRDWLLKYADSRGLEDYAKVVRISLGQQYDFSQGGIGMERIWQRYGRPIGFSSEAAHNEQQRASELAKHFDQMVSKIDIKFTDQIADIRNVLSVVNFVDDNITAAVAQFQEALAESVSISKLNMSISLPRLLVPQFRNLWESLALVYYSEGSNSEELKNSLVRVAFLAELSTSDLRSLFTSDLHKFYIPDLRAPPQLEDSVLQILNLTRQGQARQELSYFISVLENHSKDVVKSMHPHTIVAYIVTQYSQQLINVIPEAADIKEITQFSQGIIDNPGNAAVILAHHLLDFYVCPLPLDPAIAQHVWYERYIRLKKELANDEECWNELKEVVGSRSTDIETYMQKRELQDEPIPSIYRPRQSFMGIVHQDMVAAAQLSKNALKSFKGAEEVEVILKNADHLSARLARASGYRDLAVAVRSALSLLRLGLSLQSNSSITTAENNSLGNSNLWLLNPTIVGRSTQVSINYPLLVLKSMQCCLTIPTNELQELLMDVYRRWTLERLKVEEQQREQAAGFRYDNDDDEDAVAEREFRSLFPDYDEVPDLPQREDTFVPDLVENYCELLVTDGDKSSSCVETIVQAAEQLNSAKGDSSAVHLPALYLALRRRISESGSKTSVDFNFYTDASKEETQASVRFAEKVCQRVAPLLEMWPEHDTLQTLERINSEVMVLPPQAPVAFHLSKLEQTHQYLYEWDRFASKEFKVSDLMADASALVVRWRRLELATWPALFNVERRRCVEAAAPFWFHLFETLIASPSEDMTSIAKVLIVFMSESPIGQFERRLTLLHAFKKHLHLLGLHDIQLCVKNIHRYYSLFLPQVLNTIETLESQLRKQVNEVIQLASWRDVNIHALKQSAQRSHRQLFKVVKKYRAMLETKSNTESDIAKFSGDSPESLVIRVSDQEWSKEWLKPLLETVEWQKRPKHLRDLENTQKMINSYVSKISAEGPDTLNDASLLTLATDVEKRAKKLRDETPKTWTKENKKTISALRVEKQQLLTETLRELKKSGLRTSINKATLANQFELTRVLATAPKVDTDDDKDFYHMIEILPRLRSAVSETSSNGNVHDVPHTDLQRGLAYAENAFAHSLKLRRVAARYYTQPDVNIQKTIINSLAEIARSPVLSQFDFLSARNAVNRCSNVVKNVTEVIHQTLEEITAGPLVSKEISQLQNIVNRSTNMSEVTLRTSETQKWFNSVEVVVSSIFNGIDRSRSSGLVTPLLDELTHIVAEYANNVEGINSLGEDENVDETIVRASQPVLVIFQQVVELLSNHNASFQSNDGEESDDVEWFTVTLALWEKLLLTMRPVEVWKRFERASDVIFKLSSTNEKLAGAYAASLIVFINGYKSLSTVIETLYLRLMSTTTSGTLKFSTLLYYLATQGFCSPEPTGDDDDEDEKAGDGVGLGDGQGGQSTSNDVDEEDDDVAEAMQTSNPEQQEHDEADDEEDKAKEMEGDMAGQNEEIPPGDNDDEDDAEDQDEDEDNIDDEVGDLDDLDPNAIDEKMWDDQKEEPNEKEKETDQGVKGEKDDEAEAGNDNEEDQRQADAEGDDEQDSKDDPNSSDNDEASDVETHDDNVNQGDRNDLEEEVEQKEALELPDDIQLDSGEEDNSKGEDEDNGDDQDGESDNGDNDGEVEPNPDDPLDDDVQDDDEKTDDAESNNFAEEQKAENENEDQNNEDMDIDNDGGDDNEMEPEDHAGDTQDEPSDMEVDPENAEGGDSAGADIEGLQGPNENKELQNEDQATSTEQKTDSSGQGASEEANAEQNNVSMGGSLGASSETCANEDQNDLEHAKNETIKESLKQLGDAMKEFHRRQRPIKEHDPNAEEEDQMTSEKTEDKPIDGTEDFEHVGVEDQFDTQALGKSKNDDQPQEIDNSMAIDDDEQIQDPEEKEVAGEEDAGADAGAGAPAEAMQENEDEISEEEAPQSLVNINQGNLDDDEDTPSEEEKESSIDVTKHTLTTREEDDLWHLYESKTHDLALVLGEQLRLILEPTVASKLRGDYRTGKRLNMKRIIPYIASEFRKDKIWLRRSKPAKREYQIILALDDSKSMGEPAVVDLAFQAIALVGKALSSIEAGQIGIAKFGSSTEIIHPLDMPFTPHAGNMVLQQFGFDQNRTNIHELLAKSLDMFAEHSKSAEQWKLEIIVSDGIADDHAGLRTLVRRAYDERVMLVFVILDALNKDNSILNMNEVKYTTDEHGNPKLEVAKYMEAFPFDYYVIVQDINDLPLVLASVLRQYFQAADL